jgi:hypothetical protein
MEGKVETFCDCIAGGECLKRGAEVQHSVTVWWVDDRAPDTIATPLALDEWMATGNLLSAHCPTCDDDVTGCPAFAKYLLDPHWDLAFWGRNALGDLVRECREDSAGRLNDLRSGMAYLLATHGGGRVQVSRANISAATQLHQMWIDDTITLATVHYWHRVLQRFGRLAEG